METHYVYIMASKRNGTLYTGKTRNLIQRVYNHKHDFTNGFIKRYGVHLPVYYELYQDHHSALQREKQIKDWKRRWKLNHIEKFNPE